MLLNRESLKNLFKKGKFPSENHFAHLIDSSINKVEDGFGKTPEDGLQLSPQGNHEPVMSVYERLDMPRASWQVKLLKNEEGKGLSFEKQTLNRENEVDSDSHLFLGNNGKVGINTTQPVSDLEVNGTVGIQTRVGRHFGVVPGDGKWHPILCHLTGVQAFEVVARIDGPKNHGKYAITHAVALAAFGGRHARKRIRQTRSYYGFFWNRIDLKWAGDTKDYHLMVRTWQHYGEDENGQTPMIKFHLTKLWDDSLFAGDIYPDRTCADIDPSLQEKPA